MKQILTIPLLIICFSSFAQKQKDPTEDDVNKLYNSLPKANDGYEWAEVVQLDSAYKKDDLYKNAKLFFTDIFKSAKDVLQYDDRTEGKVIGKGNFKIEDNQLSFLVAFHETRYVNFTIEIFCKDGKYRYRIYNVHSDCNVRTSGGSSPDQISNYDLTIDQAYTNTNKGVDKKLQRRLFVETFSELHKTIDQIKQYMAKKQSTSDF